MKDSRRSFLKSVSMLAAGTILPLNSFAFGLGEKKLKLCLIGTGVELNLKVAFPILIGNHYLISSLITS